MMFSLVNDFQKQTITLKEKIVMLEISKLKMTSSRHQTPADFLFVFSQSKNDFTIRN